MELNPNITQISNTGLNYRVVEVFKHLDNYAVTIKYADGNIKKLLLNKQNKPIKEL